VMHAGQHVMIADGQKHAIHADVHITSLEQMITMANKLYQSVPPASAIAAMIKVQQYTQICVPHTQAHLELLANDKMHQQAFQALRARLGTLNNSIKQIDAIVEQGQEQQKGLQGAQQTAQTKDQIRMQEAQSEIAIERALAASKIQNQHLKTMSQIQTSQAKAAAHVVSPRQAMTAEVAQANQLTSPIQPPGGGLNGAGGTAPGLGAEEMPLE
jgi:hypothetical protein